MGGVKSKALRPLKGYNFENRAQKFVAKEKESIAPKAAPKHVSSMELLEKHAEAHPEIMTNLKAKDDTLIDRMNQLKIEQTGKPIDPVFGSSKKLPERRTKLEEPELAFEEPERVPEGKASLSQMHEFINEHCTNADQYTAKYIAEQYKIDSAVVEQVLKHFLPLQVKFKLSEEFKKDHKKIAKELRKQGYIMEEPEVAIEDIDTKKLAPGKS